MQFRKQDGISDLREKMTHNFQRYFQIAEKNLKDAEEELFRYDEQPKERLLAEAFIQN